MKIVFFYKENPNEIIDGTSGGLFVMDDEVYQDNYKTFESQSSVITFYDFITDRPDIGWRIE